MEPKRCPACGIEVRVLVPSDDGAMALPCAHKLIVELVNAGTLDERTILRDWPKSAVA